MTIKHSISKIVWAIVWALNYYIIELSWVPKQLPGEFQTVETICGREGHTRPRGPSENPDGVDPNIRRTRKPQRDGHNSGVKIWRLCSVSSILSHENPWTTLSNPCNKARGKYICQEVFLCLPSCVLYSCVLYSSVFRHASLSLCRCELFYIYMCIYVDVNLHMWLYNITLIWCLCQQSSSRIQNEPGYRKRQFLSITTRHQREEQRKMLELKEVERKNKNKQATIRGTDRRGKNRKKTRKQCNVLEDKKKKKKKRRKKFVSRLQHSYNSLSLSIILDYNYERLVVMTRAFLEA